MVDVQLEVFLFPSFLQTETGAYQKNQITTQY
jgi:hypothetical protein